MAEAEAEMSEDTAPLPVLRETASPPTRDPGNGDQGGLTPTAVAEQEAPAAKPAEAASVANMPPPPPILAARPDEEPAGWPIPSAPATPPRPPEGPRFFLAEKGTQTSPSRRAIALAGAAAAAAMLAIVAVVMGVRGGDDPAPPAPQPAATPEAPRFDPASPENVRLLKLIPHSYPAGVCVPVAPDPGALAQVACGPHPDAGAPSSATYQLAAGSGPLARLLAAAQDGVALRICPGRIQSPGPWRRASTPSEQAGTVFCGQRGERPVMGWSDDRRKVLAVIASRSAGASAEQLYRWWSRNS